MIQTCQGRLIAISTALGAAGWLVACENPQPPGLCGAIPQQTIVVGETVAVTACFDDPNGDMLSYGAWSSNPAVAAISRSESTVTVAAVAPGTALVTVVATDATGLKAQQSLRVLVPNRAPVAVGTIPAYEVMAGDSATVDASGYFSDPDGQGLSYTVASDTGGVVVSVTGDIVTVVAVAKGTMAVTVTAADPGGLTAAQSFQVTVPNRAPLAEGTIPAQTVEAGETVALDMSPYFSDPDGDALAYAVAASDTSVVEVMVLDSAVTVIAIAKGEATVTVTATDTEGLAATREFVVTVPNRPPVAVDAIPAQTVEAGETAALNMSPYFSDPDGDALAHEAATSDPSVAKVTVSDNTVTVTAVAKGEATVTVTATDTEGLAAIQEFGVTVPNRPPVAEGAIPAQTVAVGDTITMNMSPYFSDPDGDALAHEAAMSDTSVAKVTVSDSTVTVTAVASGEATVTVTATDTEGLAATQKFGVTVPNRSPEATGAIPAQTVIAGDSFTLDMTPYFNDPDGDALDVEAASSDARVASAAVSGGKIAVRGVARGTATVTITARDPGGLAATQGFRVTVARRRVDKPKTNRAPTVVSTIGPQTIEIGGSISFRPEAHFSDPDEDELDFEATGSDAGVATATASGSIVVVRAVDLGTATVTITARDPGGLTAALDFRVTVEKEYVGPNRSPVTVSAIPELNLKPEERADMGVQGYFSDPDNDDLSYSASSSAPNKLSVSMSGDRLTFEGKARGHVTVTVTATDPGNLTAERGFRVVVTGEANRPPVAVGSIPPARLSPGSGWSRILPNYFSDPDDDDLHYSVAGWDPGVVEVELIGGSLLSLEGVAPGQTEVTVTATDPRDLTAEQSFAVTVTGKPRNRPPQGSVPSPATVAMGDTLEHVWNLAHRFVDPDGDVLEFTAAVSNADVAVAWVDVRRVEWKRRPRLFVAGVTPGETEATVTATDPHGLSVTATFVIKVPAAGPSNLGDSAPDSSGQW